MIVFDLDDTLYLERDFALSGYAVVGEMVRARYGVDGFDEVCAALLEARQGFIIDAALAQVGLAGEDGLAAELIDAYRYHTPDIALAPDAERYLAGQGGAVFGLITDGHARTQAAKIAALGLERRIDHICMTGTLGEGKKKPHPEAYMRMEAARPTGERHCYVADNPAKDFLCPKARGWLCVQITREGGVHSSTPPDADHSAHKVISSLDSLEETLTELSY